MVAEIAVAETSGAKRRMHPGEGSREAPSDAATRRAAAISGRPVSELRLLYQAVRKGYKDQAKDLAAAIAYYTFFSIFPLLLGLTSAAGYFLESEVARARLYELIAETLPGSAALVRQNLDSVFRVRGALGIFGVLGLFWSGSAGFGAVTRAVNRALGAKRSHPFFLSKLRYFLMTVSVSVLIVFSVAMTAMVEVVANLDLEILARVGFEPSLFTRLGSWVLSFLFVFLTFALIYKVTPYIETRWRQILPGAFLGAAVFELVKATFLLYLDRLADFEAVYGSLSSIIVLLLWFYCSALVLIFGAEYNIVRWRARATETNPGGGS
jgi:membrane protein